MKGKKSLILASIFAGVGLVGATFAAWAVTDNAAQKSIKISTETIQTDTSTSYVTLEWGASTKLTDVSNLETGSKRLAGIVGLKSTYTGSQSYNGLLTAAMSQTSKVGAKLLDYLKVSAYVEGEDETEKVVYDENTKVVTAVPASSSNKYIELNGGAETPVLNGQKVVAMPNASEVKVFFVVELASGAAEELTTIKNDVVNLTVDWNHSPTGQEVTSGNIVYYNPGALNEGEKVFCYAWDGKRANGDFPGAVMTNEGNGIYSYVISTDENNGFSNFILSHGTISEKGDVNVSKATVSEVTEFEVATLTNSNNYFTNTTRGAKPEADPSLTADYYLVGDMEASNWGCKSSLAMTKDTTVKDDSNEDTYKIEGVALAAGQKIKVRNNSNNSTEEWYSNVSTWTDCGYTLDNEGNIIVSVAGTYNVRLYKNSTYNNHVLISKVA